MDQDINPIVKPLYHNGQFLGFSVSSSCSQSISKTGSVVPVVPMDVALRERGVPPTRDVCGVSAFSGSSQWSWTEIVSAIEASALEDEVESMVWGRPFSVSGEDIEARCSGAKLETSDDIPSLHKSRPRSQCEEGRDCLSLIYHPRTMTTEQMVQGSRLWFDIGHSFPRSLSTICLKERRDIR